MTDCARLHANGGMLEKKWAALFGVALETRDFVAYTMPHVCRGRRAVRIMAVPAVDRALVSLCPKGRSKLARTAGWHLAQSASLDRLTSGLCTLWHSAQEMPFFACGDWNRWACRLSDAWQPRQERLIVSGCPPAKTAKLGRIERLDMGQSRTMA